MSVAGSRVVIYKPQGESTVAFFATTAGERKRFKFVQLNSMTILPVVILGISQFVTSSGLKLSKNVYAYLVRPKGKEWSRRKSKSIF